MARTKLSCSECGLLLIDIPKKLTRFFIMHVKWIVQENILGPAPKSGDIWDLTCKCGHQIRSTFDLIRD